MHLKKHFSLSSLPWVCLIPIPVHGYTNSLNQTPWVRYGADEIVNMESYLELDRTPGRLFGVSTPSSLLPIKGLDCLSSALTTVVTNSLESGSQLMQACSRDLLAAAVGGAKLLQNPRRRRRRLLDHDSNKKEEDEYEDKNEKSDLAVLSNPNFSVTQSLVETMAEAAGKALFADDTGVLLMTDALAACLFSPKLESNYRFWALEQLLKVFASSTRKDISSKPQPEDLVLPSHVLQLIGHTGQVIGVPLQSHTLHVMYSIDSAPTDVTSSSIMTYIV